jgi:hypothetical protein
MNTFEPLGERRPVPKLARILIILLIVSVIALVILMGLQQPDSSTQNGSVEFVIATQELTSGEDLVIGVNNATLYVPRAAVELAGSIVIFPREPNLFSMAGEPEWLRPLVVNIEYRDEAGTPYTDVTFSMPVQMCFKMIPDRWKDYTNNPDDYRVQYYAEEQDPPRWESLLPMQAYPERSELCGETNHLSLFALATKTDTTIPVTGADPTPGPKNLLETLINILGQNSGDSSGGGSGGAYEP